MSARKMVIKCAENQRKCRQNIKLRKIAKKIMRYGIRSTQYDVEIIATYTIKYDYTTTIYKQ
jgi:hypothetical protein